ncbi:MULTISPECIES: nitroreductase family protein [Methanobacterium]|uniref:Nitroreductase family protein n=1 Tax=Methanobacterium veterum TaxID=408577 RepID=A0A9E5DI75_9EURY|nr:MULTISPECIES: nitroreductase family protein [Methanobacterium]MCZ3364902.1 nitroreductase family protein [Methanobacterium veterum]MCZ3372657.1 nitroreductase family protein [Methanobacterium veterum]
MENDKMGDISNECSDAFDNILESRRSIRFFKDEIPPKEYVEDIIRAGLFAPYAAQAVDENEYFRKFIVISKNSEKMKEVAEIAKNKVKIMSEQLNAQMEENPYLKEKAKSFSKRLELFAEKGVLGIGTAPYYIVVAEKKGVPPVEQQSLAHCLQNMWLKAASLDLGFHLVSATAQMEENKDFCEILGINPGEWGLNGCAVGYPEEIPPETSRPAVSEVTMWID